MGSWGSKKTGGPFRRQPWAITWTLRVGLVHDQAKKGDWEGVGAAPTGTSGFRHVRFGSGHTLEPVLRKT